MTFTPENLWLKDYYNSQISHRTKNFEECEATIKLALFPDSNNSSHLMMTSDQDMSGMTPPRFPTQVEHGDHQDTLRV